MLPFLRVALAVAFPHINRTVTETPWFHTVRSESWLPPVSLLRLYSSHLHSGEKADRVGVGGC